MVMEKVKEIKQAEEKADAIIRRAEERAGGIAASLETEVNKLRDSKEKEFSAAGRKYRADSDKQAEDRINVLKQEYLHKLAAVRETAERKITAVAESVWNEIKSFLSMP